MTHTLLTERRAAVRGFCSLLLMTLVLAPMACKSKKVRVGATDEETPKMHSVLTMGDPKVEPQLVKGFHGVEAGAWRWTEKQFTVALRPPFGAAQKGAKLTVKLTDPARDHREVEDRLALGHGRKHRAASRDLFHRRRLYVRPRHSGQRAQRAIRCASISSWIRPWRRAAPIYANSASSC